MSWWIQAKLPIAEVIERLADPKHDVCSGCYTGGPATWRSRRLLRYWRRSRTPGDR